MMQSALARQNSETSEGRHAIVDQDQHPDVTNVGLCIFAPFTGFSLSADVDFAKLSEIEKLNKIIANVAAHQVLVKQKLDEIWKKRAQVLKFTANKEVATLVREQLVNVADIRYDNERNASEIDAIIRRCKTDAGIYKARLNSDGVYIEKQRNVDQEGDFNMTGSLVEKDNNKNTFSMIQAIHTELSEKLEELHNQQAAEINAYDQHSRKTLKFYEAALDRRLNPVTPSNGGRLQAHVATPTRSGLETEITTPSAPRLQTYVTTTTPTKPRGQQNPIATPTKPRGQTHSSPPSVPQLQTKFTTPTRPRVKTHSSPPSVPRQQIQVKTTAQPSLESIMKDLKEISRQNSAKTPVISPLKIPVQLPAKPRVKSITDIPGDSPVETSVQTLAQNAVTNSVQSSEQNPPKTPVRTPVQTPKSTPKTPLKSAMKSETKKKSKESPVTLTPRLPNGMVAVGATPKGTRSVQTFEELVRRGRKS